jgi:alanyl-tRNA synthetase
MFGINKERAGKTGEQEELKITKVESIESGDTRVLDALKAGIVDYKRYQELNDAVDSLEQVLSATDDTTDPQRSTYVELIPEAERELDRLIILQDQSGSKSNIDDARLYNYYSTGSTGANGKRVRGINSIAQEEGK